MNIWEPTSDDMGNLTGCDFRVRRTFQLALSQDNQIVESALQHGITADFKSNRVWKWEILMVIKILGTGCENCKRTKQIAADVIDRNECRRHHRRGNGHCRHHVLRCDEYTGDCH